MVKYIKVVFSFCTWQVVYRIFLITTVFIRIKCRRTTSPWAQLCERILEMCEMNDDLDMPKVGKHRELKPAQIKKS